MFCCCSCSSQVLVAIIKDFLSVVNVTMSHIQNQMTEAISHGLCDQNYPVAKTLVLCILFDFVVTDA